MKRLTILMLMLGLGFAPVACSSSTTTDNGGSDDSQSRADQFDNLPAWVISPPSEPGQAFYGVGVSTYRNPAQISRAMTAAGANARAQIAATMRQQVQSLTRDYQRQILAPNGELEEEGLSESVLRAMTNFEISGAEIQKQAFWDDERNNMTVVYVLARIGFDSVAENLHKVNSEAIASVEANAEDAFNRLDDMLREQEYTPPAGSRTPPTEGN